MRQDCCRNRTHSVPSSRLAGHCVNCTTRRRAGCGNSSWGSLLRCTDFAFAGTSERASLRQRRHRRFRGVHDAWFAQVNDGDVVGMDFLPAIDMIEQLRRCALRVQQRRLDVVLREQAEQTIRLRLTERGVVIEEGNWEPQLYDVMSDWGHARNMNMVD